MIRFTIRAGRRVARRCARFGVVVLVTSVVSLSALAKDWRVQTPGSIVAISDVHGDYDAMVATLKNAGVVDADLNWVAGETQLVITGDLLDRGAHSRQVMDLVRSLEASAPPQGGAVHLLLGNHEVMNLVGDLRYVARGEYAAFADDEDAAERESWLEMHLSTLSPETDVDEARAAWERRHPPGFFGHRRAFRSDGEYGAWLLERPLMVVINGTAFVHGGLSPRIAELGLDGVNDGLGSELRRYVEALGVLVDAKLLSPSVGFYEQADALSAWAGDGTLAQPVRDAVERIAELQASELHAPQSPLWYRGNVGCSAPIETDRLDSVLAAIGAERVVVGHTPTATRDVLSRLDGRVIEIDTGMLNDYYGGSGNALRIDADGLDVIREVSAAAVAVTAHPRRVGMRSVALTADRLEEILRNGEIADVAELDIGRVVSVRHEDVEVNALFVENPRRRGVVPELAAYQLDRFLELGMVPVTVQREYDGDDGVLQFLPADDRRLNEVQRINTGQGGSAWCPLQEQWNAMYVFDALIGNPGRAREQMLYSPDNFQLVLIGHGRTFGTSRGLPAYLDAVPFELGVYWRDRLRELTEERMAELFGDSLDRRRLRALSQRRDALLEREP